MFATVLDYGFRVCTVCYIEANLEHEKSYVIWKVSNVKNLTYPQPKFIVALSWWSIYDLGAQWFSGGVLDLRLRGRKFQPRQRHCIVALEQDTFILA